MVKLAYSISAFQNEFLKIQSALERQPQDVAQILDALNALGNFINKTKQINTIRNGQLVSDAEITAEITSQAAKSESKVLEEPLNLSTESLPLLEAVSAHIEETNTKLNSFPEQDEYRKLYNNLLVGLHAFKARANTTPNNNIQPQQLQETQINKWLEDKTCEIIAASFTAAQTEIRDSICTKLDSNNGITAGRILNADGMICENKITIELIAKTTKGSEIRDKMTSDRLNQTNFYHQYSTLNEYSSAAEIRGALQECADFKIEKKITPLLTKVKTDIKDYNALETAKKIVTNKGESFATKMSAVKQFIPSSATTYSSSSTTSETPGILAALGKFLYNLFLTMVGLKTDAVNAPTVAKTPSAPSPMPWGADSNCSMQQSITTPQRPVFSLTPAASVP